MGVEHDSAVDIQKSGKLWKILLGLVPLLIVTTVVVRQAAQQFDGSLANIFTLILGFFAWLLLTIGLARSPWPRAYWCIVGLAPFAVAGVIMAQYRIVRLDGELLPQFESRWKLTPGLPSESGSFQVVPFIEPALYQATGHDFPQFMGPDRDGVVDSIQLETDWIKHPPRMLWKYPIGAGWSGFAVQGSVAITLEQRDKEQWVSAYKADKGKLFWHVPFAGSHFNPLGGAGPRATPTIDGNYVYIQTATGQVACLELSKGEIVWQHDLLEMAGWDQAASEKAISWGRAASPLIVDELVVVPFGGPSELGDRSLIAFDKSTGDVAWRAGNQQISYSSPSLMTLLGTRQIVIVNEKSVTGHDPTTGQILWESEWDGASDGAANVSQTIKVNDSQLLISKGYTQGAKLIELAKDDAGKWSTKDLWQKSSVLKTKFTSAVKLGDYAYGLSDGTLECVRIADGQRQWKNGRYKHGQLLLVGDVLLITEEYGDLVLVAAKPDNYEELAKIQVFEAVTWNVPALAGNLLLIRNADEAACYELPLATPVSQ